VPEAVILAGPNGAGKTTFANEYLRIERPDFRFINADYIAQQVAIPPRETVDPDRQASREMLAQLETVVLNSEKFVFQTTLASLMYARKIGEWQQRGYKAVLFYLRLPSVDVSLARVKKRVASGGHGIPEPVIRRRFMKSLNYLERIYKPIVDEWYIWDSLEGEFRAGESGGRQ
jgi:predicted ABC-type ATPase